MGDKLDPLRKVTGPLLREGESVLGGTKAGGRNAAVKSGAAAGFGGAVGALAGAAMKGGSADGKAARVPQDRLYWIAVTPHRMLYFSSQAVSGAPKKLMAETDLAEVGAVAVRPGRMQARFAFSFDDGSVAEIDVGRLANPDSLRSALEQALPGQVTVAG